MAHNTSSIRLLDKTALTIATGVITPTQCYHEINAESGTTDDLATINTSGFTQLSDGSNTYRPFIILYAASGDTITVKHGTGNISLNGAADFELSGEKLLLLFYNGANWADVGAGSGGGGGTMSSFTAAGDSGGGQAISDGNTLTIAGGTGITTTDSATDTVTIDIDSTVATLTGSQTLTNKTIDGASNTITNVGGILQSLTQTYPYSSNADTTSSSYVEADTTWRLTITTGGSSTVIVSYAFQGVVASGTSAEFRVVLHDGTSDVTADVDVDTGANEYSMTAATGTNLRLTAKFSGLAADTYTTRLQFKATSGTARVVGAPMPLGIFAYEYA